MMITWAPDEAFELRDVQEPKSAEVVVPGLVGKLHAETWGWESLVVDMVERNKTHLKNTQAGQKQEVLFVPP